MKNSDPNYHGAARESLCLGSDMEPVYESYGSLVWYEVATLVTRKAVKESRYGCHDETDRYEVCLYCQCCTLLPATGGVSTFARRRIFLNMRTPASCIQPCQP